MKKVITAILATTLALSLFAGCSQAPAKKVTSQDDLKKGKIAVQEATTGDIYVGDEFPDATISRFKSALDAGLDLKNGKVDAVILDELPAKKIVSKNPTLKIMEEALTKEEYAIAIKKGNTELLNNVNKAITAMKADGRFDLIVKAYIDLDEAAVAELAKKPEPKGDKTLTMGTNASFPPFEYRDDAGNVTGFDAEMAKEIARELKMSFKIEDMNFDSLPNAINSGKIDMAVAGMTVTEERKQNMDFSVGYYLSTQVIIVQK